MEINATILVSAISFIAFIFIMNKILYAPVIEIMEKRQNYIDSNKSEANEHREKTQKLIEDKDSKIAQAQRQSRDVVATKAEALKEESSRVLRDAKNSATEYFNNEKQGLAQQKAEITSNMKFDVADLANKLTTKLMGEGVAFNPLSENEVEEVMNKNV